MIGLVQIPSTAEAVDPKGPVYTIFNIHVNGCYHGSFRYSQLLAFHQEVKAQFDVSSLEDFPSKHWFGTLSPEQLFARRIGLERYLHSLCQDRIVGTSDTLKEFFIAIQKASTDVSQPSAEVEVFLVNGKSVNVKVGSFDRTDQVLEKVASEIKLAPQLTYYFGLFFEKEEEGSWLVDRSLTDYECPYVSLQAISKSGPHRITIRKSFWDPVFIPELVEDRVAKNLLYIEALSSIALGQWEVTLELKKQLSMLQKKGHKKEYLELVGTLLQFGFIQLDGLTLDHPTDDLTGHVRVGKLEIVSYSREDADSANKVFTYPLTKIRSWKLGGKPGSPWLKFFFQVGAGDFIPVSVVGAQTVLLSHCLHSVVDELLRVRAKQNIRQPQTQAIVRAPRELPKVVFYEAPVPITTSPSEDAPEDTSTPEADTESTASETTPISPPDHTHDEPQAVSDRTKRLTSVSSVGEPDVSKPMKLKTPKQKLLPSVSDIENPTFEFGTDDDL